MIRLVSFEPMDPELLQKLTRVLFQAFGLGCEYVGEVPLPAGTDEDAPLEAVALLHTAPAVKSFADDKVVYLTSRPLAPRKVPGGLVPTPGYSDQGGERALVTAFGLPDDLDERLRRMGKQAMHEVGHLWALHHCLDPRCAMYAPWARSFVSGEPSLCIFCRERSERRIRLAKT